MSELQIAAEITLAGLIGGASGMVLAIGLKLSESAAYSDDGTGLVCTAVVIFVANILRIFTKD